MKIIISGITSLHVFNTQAVIKKCYRATVEVIAKIQHTNSATLDETLWHTLETYTEVKTKYVER